jgi:uncharacterized protein (DUF488 family)
LPCLTLFILNKIKFNTSSNVVTNLPCPVFYRRKIILALLQLFEGRLEKIQLQKLLFLFSKQQEKAAYDFVPYKYGCYSFSANADMTAMVNRNLVNEDEKSFEKKDNIDYLNELKPVDLKLLQDVKDTYGSMGVATLIKYTYVKFPFYTTKSVVAESILSKDELEKVKKSKPIGNKTVLYTIGYEGISLEEYLVRLVKNDVKVLVDVRNKPMSMKFGFSKSQLQKFCASLDIAYMHFPEVGIQSDQRQKLTTQRDYDQLFRLYCHTNLTNTASSQLAILNVLKQYKRIALTCFEANICQCHRKHLAEAIENLPDFNYEVKHL